MGQGVRANPDLRVLWGPVLGVFEGMDNPSPL
jgi:hypothetical protein